MATFCLGDDVVARLLGYCRWHEAVRCAGTCVLFRRCAARALRACPKVTLCDAAKAGIGVDAVARQLLRWAGGTLGCWKMDASGCPPRAAFAVARAAAAHVRVASFAGVRRGDPVAFAACLRACGGALVTLNLAKCGWLKDAGAAAIAASCPSLRKLYLNSCRSLTDAATKSLRSLRDLRTLYLSCCARITDAGAAHLFDRRRSPALASLRTLCLTQTKITDVALDHLANSRAGLRTLVVSHCSGVTIAGLQNVMSKLPNCDVKNHHGFAGNRRL